MFVLSLPAMKPFKIKAIKTYVSYVTTFIILHIMCALFLKRKWHLHKTLYNICLKTGLFEVKLYYINFIRLFVLRKPRNLEARRINLHWKKPRWQVSNFPSDFRCSKSIFTFLLQITWTKRLLMFVLYVKRCFNANKEAFSSTYYLLITKIHTYKPTKNLNKLIYFSI